MLLYRRDAEPAADEDDDGGLMRRAFAFDDGSEAGDDDEGDAAPPIDGLEYLRRVRKEARRLPSIVRADISDPAHPVAAEAERDSSSFLPPPPAALCPDRLWEQQLICEFAKLQQRLAAAAISPIRQPGPSLPNVADTSAWENFCFGREGAVGQPPALCVVLQLDQRAALRLLQMMHSRLKREGVLSDQLARWIFALLSRPEQALPAEHAATLRALLRTCAQLRVALGEAEPSQEIGSELWMQQAAALNTIISIIGGFFGQASAEERGGAGRSGRRQC